MAKKKAGKRAAQVKSSKVVRRAGASELSDAQLDQVAGGVDSFTGIKGEAESKEHQKHIEIESYSFGVSQLPGGGGLKSR